MDNKLPKMDIFFDYEIYPAFLTDVKITDSSTEKIEGCGDDVIGDFYYPEYDVTFKFIVYNGVSYKIFYRKFEKILTSGKDDISYFCYQMVDQPYWGTDTVDEWKEFCKTFELSDFFGGYMDVDVEDFSIPTVRHIVNSNFYETDENCNEEEFDYDTIFKDYECKKFDDLYYDSVNEAIRDGLMHYFD